MSNKKMTINELISFFEMSVKVEWWSNPEYSTSYQADKAFRELVAEIAALKARADPLAEMWRELSEYQEQANTNGHGESWAKMCAERTAKAAWAAIDGAGYVAGNKVESDAATAAVEAAAAGVQATATVLAAAASIAAIRRAKEGTR